MNEPSTNKRETLPECGCIHCSGIKPSWSRMIVCEHCGNKRCPHASYHGFGCTNSNASGQRGSVFGPQDTAAPPDKPSPATEVAALREQLMNALAQLTISQEHLAAAEARERKLREALMDAVSQVSTGHRGHIGDHYIRSPQISESCLECWRAALATPGDRP